MYPFRREGGFEIIRPVSGQLRCAALPFRRIRSCVSEFLDFFRGGTMTVQVIGAGVGRTGTYSLKLAINQPGIGPCRHMEEVLHNMSTQVPLWCDAETGKAD